MPTAPGRMPSGRNGSTKRTFVPIRNMPERACARDGPSREGATRDPGRAKRPGKRKTR